MNTTRPSHEAISHALDAADEALELLCRLRQIPIERLTDAELGEFFFNALESEFGAILPPDDGRL
jgi:hypothetical protein